MKCISSIITTVIDRAVQVRRPNTINSSHCSYVILTVKLAVPFPLYFATSILAFLKMKGGARCSAAKHGSRGGSLAGKLGRSRYEVHAVT